LTPIFVVMMLVIVIAFDKNTTKGWQLLACSLFMTLLYGLWNSPPPPRADGKEDKNFEKKARIWLAVGIFFTPLLVGQVHDKGLQWAMTAIGIKIEGATIQLTDKYAKILQLNDIGPERKHGKRLAGYYTNADILINGVGTNNVIEIDGFKLIVPAKEAIIGIGNSTTKKKT
jgi:hypothetical protein